MWFRRNKDRLHTSKKAWSGRQANNTCKDEFRKQPFPMLLNPQIGSLSSPWKLPELRSLNRHKTSSSGPTSLFSARVSVACTASSAVAAYSPSVFCLVSCSESPPSASWNAWFGFFSWAPDGEPSVLNELSPKLRLLTACSHFSIWSSLGIPGMRVGEWIVFEFCSA